MYNSEASHNAEVLVKAIQAVDVIRTLHCPITVPNKLYLAGIVTDFVGRRVEVAF